MPLELDSELSVDEKKAGKGGDEKKPAEGGDKKPAKPAENPLDKEMADLKNKISEC